MVFTFIFDNNISTFAQNVEKIKLNNVHEALSTVPQTGKSSISVSYKPGTL